MANGFNTLGSLGEETVDYLRLRWASLRLGTVERLSTAASKVLGMVLSAALLLFALMLLLFALAFWIGEILGHLSLGFLISGGVFLIAGVVVFFLGRRMFANSMVRHFVDMFFTDNDYEHGTRG